MWSNKKVLVSYYAIYVLAQHIKKSITAHEVSWLTVESINLSLAGEESLLLLILPCILNHIDSELSFHSRYIPFPQWCLWLMIELFINWMCENAEFMALDYTYAANKTKESEKKRSRGKRLHKDSQSLGYFSFCLSNERCFSYPIHSHKILPSLVVPIAKIGCTFTCNQRMYELCTGLLSLEV